MRRKLRRHVETVVLHFGDHDSPGPGGIITEKQLKHAEARERREAELRRVTSRMRKSGWRCLEDIATNYGLGEEADIYRLLLAAMRAGKFDEFGVLFLNADPRARRDQRVTRAVMENMIELFRADIDEKSPRSSQIVLHFLRHCWMPDALYRQFADDLKQTSEPPSTVTRETAVPADLDNCAEGPGAPPIYDHDQIRGEAFRQFKQRGLPSRDGDKGWQTRADLEKLIEDFCDSLYGRRPVKSTLQRLAKRALSDWQAGR